jgi:hypothetical protein
VRTREAKENPVGCEPTGQEQDNGGESNDMPLEYSTLGADPLSVTALLVCRDAEAIRHRDGFTYESLALLISFAPLTEVIDTPEARRYRSLARLCEGALDLKRLSRREQARQFFYRCECRQEAAKP